MPSTEAARPAELRVGDSRGGSGEMFDRIAARYDLLNRVLSFGLDVGWRERTLAALDLRPDQRLLDLATGTADLALLAAVREPGLSVRGVDPSARMLELGRRKAHELCVADRVTLELGDAQSLPFPDGEFDAVTIAFGIRNVPDRALALREMARVTRLGGRVAVLELTDPAGSSPLAWAARLHVRTLVPRIGAWLSGAPEYRYLQQSIAAFPPPPEFAELMGASGLTVLEVVPLTFGAAHLFLATPARPEATAP